MEAIYENDLDAMESQVEPLFFQQATKKVQSMHDLLDKHSSEVCLNLQNLRHGHQTEFFLYNIENKLLCGDSVSIDRRKNKPVADFMSDENTEFIVNEKEIIGEAITNT